MDMLFESSEDVEIVPDRCSGSPVFRGTRVAVSVLVEHLEQGGTIDQFMEWFEGVDRVAVERVAKLIEPHLLPAS
ncbi:MAG: DUF433 domain-containing protein [Blastochloris sp.]|nr:DUF433 domain-containing protein [Blastochloris sp.]